MKKVLVLFYFLFGCIAVGFCQSGKVNADDLSQKAAVLQQQLKLTDAQTSKIATIFKESSAKLQEIIKDKHGDTDKILAAMGPLRAETLKKIILLLTPEQAIKFNRLVAELNSPTGDKWTPDRPRPVAP